MRPEEALGSTIIKALVKMLAQQKAYQQAHMADMQNDIHWVPEMDILDAVADILGVPEDNTTETCACEIANETGVWPEGSYSRDWIYNAWNGVLYRGVPIEKFIDAIQSQDSTFVEVGVGVL